MAKVTGSNPVEPTPFDASQLSLGTHVPPACVSRRGSGPSAFPRGCGIIGCSAATHRGERLSMRAEIRDADEAPELDEAGSESGRGDRNADAKEDNPHEHRALTGPEGGIPVHGRRRGRLDCRLRLPEPGP